METLQSQLRREELELAGSIGAQAIPLKDRILELFRTLPDPLLSAEEVAKLLATPDQATVLEALGALHSEGSLERSQTTSRPLDPEGITLFRIAGKPFSRLKLVGIESRLSNGQSRIQFTCDGRLIRSIAKVDRLDSLSKTGNQRDEIARHVKSIAHGISGGTQVPNSILIILVAEQVADTDEEAPESFVRITPLGDYTRVSSPLDDSATIQEFRPIQIDFPYRRAAFDEEKSALLVDGQQRTAALSLVDIDIVPHFALSVNAQVSTAEEARAVFLVANTTAKIETQFSRALIAAMSESPAYLASERPRALAARSLAIEDPDSPFFNLVQYPGMKAGKKPPVVYNSLFQVLTVFSESSIPLGDKPEQTLAYIAKRGFNLIRQYWPTAWGLKPNDSRLMHAVGLRAMAGLLVNKLESLYPQHGSLEAEALWVDVSTSLKRLQPHLVWTIADTSNALKTAVKTYSDEISSRQNTSQDIAALTKSIKRMSLDLDTEAAKVSTKSKKP
ncbi:DGQHR domain-containing protein [Myxococcus llanfairpwllgwyngyllgogerychwyrndrobwllllantysiliogogogochensis]|uniref:DGQHR domain-containing protein n=1 Tax=Myxococcus llanfairpwllgwyngyllgogerychwyrndrobwllllantysiliogogogochensis TaxID=2590453 RepID=UPI0015F0EBA1|nr:DGQHR domain-containing protein [Myxococcus llanfairpwllgwyngyllgogerychwyrndrobwllllantysiliogogogochensis]